MGKINADCPRCNCQDTVKLSVAYMGGVSRIKTKTKSAGIGILGKKGLGIGLGVGRGKTTGTQQTALSELASPPDKAGLLESLSALDIIILIIGIIIFFFGGSNIAVLIATPIIGYPLFRGYIKRENKYKHEYSVWNNKFMCNRCGSIFKPSKEEM